MCRANYLFVMLERYGYIELAGTNVSAPLAKEDAWKKHLGTFTFRRTALGAEAAHQRVPLPVLHVPVGMA